VVREVLASIEGQRSAQLLGRLCHRRHQRVLHGDGTLAGERGPFFLRTAALSPFAGKQISMVNLLVRSTSVPIAERSRPLSKSSS
jgi:hypothetical protein